MSPVADRYAALAACVETHRETPFAWGVHDCCLWSATAVHAQTGEDPAAELRGTYDSAESARALIKARFGTIERIPGRMGFKGVAIALARRGDLVSYKFDGRGVSLGVCLGSRAAFAGEAGLVFVETMDCRKAWRVG